MKSSPIVLRPTQHSTLSRLRRKAESLSQTTRVGWSVDVRAGPRYKADLCELHEICADSVVGGGSSTE